MGALRLCANVLLHCSHLLCGFWRQNRRSVAETAGDLGEIYTTHWGMRPLC